MLLGCVLHQHSGILGLWGVQTWKSRCLEMPANTLLVLSASAISSSSGEGCICMALHKRSALFSSPQVALKKRRRLMTLSRPTRCPCGPVGH